MIQCLRCGFNVSEAELTSVQPLECPTCGNSLSQPSHAVETGLGIIQDYFVDLWRIISQPRLFFKHLPVSGGLAKPLCFALVTHWLGAALAFIWRTLFGGSLWQIIQNLFRTSDEVIEIEATRHSYLWEARDKITNWFLGAGPVVLDPFLTLLTILGTSFLVFIGARLLISPGKDGQREEITYESAARVICFGMSPAIFSAFPFIGGILAQFGVLFVTIIGVKEVYRIDTGRSIVIALFPKLIFIGIIGVGLILFAFTLFRFFSPFF